MSSNPSLIAGHGLDTSPVVEGYAYKQCHDNAKRYVLRYVLLYKGVLFYWTTYEDYAHNWPTLHKALSATTLPLFQLLRFNDLTSGNLTTNTSDSTPTLAKKLKGEDDQEDNAAADIFDPYNDRATTAFAVNAPIPEDVHTLMTARGKISTSTTPVTMTATESLDNIYEHLGLPAVAPMSGVEANQRLSSANNRMFEGFYVLVDSDVYHAPAMVATTGASARVVSQRGPLASADPDDLDGLKFNRDALASGKLQKMFALSLSVMATDQYRSFTMALSTVDGRDAWLEQIQTHAENLMFPRIFPLLHGLRVPYGATFADLHLNDLRVTLPSNQVTMFDVHEFVLLHLYTGSDTHVPPNDAHSRCVILTTHRLLHIHGSAVLAEVSFGDVERVVYAPKEGTNPRDLRLVREVAIAAPQGSVHAKQATGLLGSVLRGFGTGLTHIGSGVAALGSGVKAVGGAAVGAMGSVVDAMGGAVGLRRPRARGGEVEMEAPGTPLEVVVLPQRVQLGKARVVLLLTSGRVCPLTLSGREEADVFLANVVARVVARRQQGAFALERVAGEQLRRRTYLVGQGDAEDGGLRLDRANAKGWVMWAPPSGLNGRHQYVPPHGPLGVRDSLLGRGRERLATVETDYRFVQDGFTRLAANVCAIETGADKQFWSPDVNYVLCEGPEGVAALDMKPVGSAWDRNDTFVAGAQGTAPESRPVSPHAPLSPQSPRSPVAPSLAMLQDMEFTDSDDSDVDEAALAKQAEQVAASFSKSPRAQAQPKAKTRVATKAGAVAGKSGLLSRLTGKSQAGADTPALPQVSPVLAMLQEHLVGTPRALPHHTEYYNEADNFQLSSGNGLADKYTNAYQYEFCLAEFTGAASQQWSWGDNDALWPLHARIRPQALQGEERDSGAREGDVVVDEVWQNQRHHQCLWSNSLFPNDRPNWSTDAGAPRTLATAERDVGEGWVWVDPHWTVDTQGSPDGWWYSAGLRPGLVGCSSQWDKRKHDCRKRRWLRRRRCVAVMPRPAVEQVATDANAFANDDTPAMIVQREVAALRVRAKEQGHKLSDAAVDAWLAEHHMVPLQNVLRERPRGPGIAMEFVLEHQHWSLFSGWRPTSSRVWYPWASQDGHLRYDKGPHPPGPAYRWCSDWFIDTRVNCDQHGWRYSTAPAKQKLHGRDSLRRTYRVRRWCRYKELVPRGGMLPAFLASLCVRYEEDDTIACAEPAPEGESVQTYRMHVRSPLPSAGAVPGALVTLCDADAPDAAKWVVCGADGALLDLQLPRVLGDADTARSELAVGLEYHEAYALARGTRWNTQPALTTSVSGTASASALLRRTGTYSRLEAQRQASGGVKSPQAAISPVVSPADMRRSPTGLPSLDELPSTSPPPTAAAFFGSGAGSRGPASPLVFDPSHPGDGRSFADQLSSLLASIPDAHLHARLALWLHESRVACRLHSVHWSSRLPPPLLFSKFASAIGEAVPKLPPLPLLPVECPHHVLLWRNEHVGLWRPLVDVDYLPPHVSPPAPYSPHVPSQPPTAAQQAAILQGTTVLGSDMCYRRDGSGPRQRVLLGDVISTSPHAPPAFSTVVYDSPLLLPPLALRLVHAVSAGERPLLLFEMVPPQGYVSLGLIARSSRPTHTSLYRCVPREWCVLPDTALTRPTSSFTVGPAGPGAFGNEPTQPRAEGPGVVMRPDQRMQELVRSLEVGAEAMERVLRSPELFELGMNGGGLAHAREDDEDSPPLSPSDSSARPAVAAKRSAQSAAHASGASVGSEEKEEKEHRRTVRASSRSKHGAQPEQRNLDGDRARAELFADDEEDAPLPPPPAPPQTDPTAARAFLFADSDDELAPASPSVPARQSSRTRSTAHAPRSPSPQASTGSPECASGSPVPTLSRSGPALSPTASQAPSLARAASNSATTAAEHLRSRAPEATGQAVEEEEAGACEHSRLVFSDDRHPWDVSALPGRRDMNHADNALAFALLAHELRNAGSGRDLDIYHYAQLPSRDEHGAATVAPAPKRTGDKSLIHRMLAAIRARDGKAAVVPAEDNMFDPDNQQRRMRASPHLAMPPRALRTKTMTRVPVLALPQSDITHTRLQPQLRYVRPPQDHPEPAVPLAAQVHASVLDVAALNRVSRGETQLAFWCVQPSLNTFTVGAAGPAPSLPRLGMGLHRSPAAWMGELWVHSHACLHLFRSLLHAREAFRVKVHSTAAEVVASPAAATATPRAKPAAAAKEQKQKLAKQLVARAGKLAAMRDRVFGDDDDEGGDEDAEEDQESEDEAASEFGLYYDSDVESDYVDEEERQRLKALEAKFSSVEYTDTRRINNSRFDFDIGDGDGEEGAGGASDAEVDVEAVAASFGRKVQRVAAKEKEKDKDKAKKEDKDKKEKADERKMEEEKDAKKEKKAKKADAEEHAEDEEYVHAEEDPYQHVSAARVRQLLPALSLLVRHYALWVCQAAKLAGHHAREQDDVEHMFTTPVLARATTNTPAPAPSVSLDAGVVVGNASLNVTPQNMSLIALHDIVTIIDLGAAQARHAALVAHGVGIADVHKPLDPARLEKLRSALGKSPPAEVLMRPSFFGASGQPMDLTRVPLDARPPYSAPSTVWEHVCCLYWLQQLLLNTLTSLRVAIVEDMLHQVFARSPLDNTLGMPVPRRRREDGFEQVGALVSLLLRWDETLDIVPPLRKVDNALCCALLTMYGCKTPRRDSLIYSQPFKTFVHNRALDVVTHRFLSLIAKPLKEWDSVRSRGHLGAQPDSAKVDTLQSRNAQYFADLPEAAPAPAATAAAEEEEEDAEGAPAVEVDEDQLALEFAADLGLKMVDTSDEKAKKPERGAAREKEAEAKLQKLLVTMTSLTQDLIAVHRACRHHAAIFQLFVFTYNDLLLQVLQSSLAVEALAMNERAQVAEWLDYYYRLMATITETPTQPASSPTSAASAPSATAAGAGTAAGATGVSEDSVDKQLFGLLMSELRALKLSYVGEYIATVRQNINQLLENVFFHEQRCLPGYTVTLQGVFGRFETHAPVDVYEVLHTFSTAMLKRFQLHSLARMAGNKQPLRAEEARQQEREVSDKLAVLEQLLVVVCRTQAYYYSSLASHLERAHRANIANLGGVNCPYEYDKHLFTLREGDGAVGETKLSSEASMEAARDAPVWHLDRAVQLYSIANKDHKVNVQRRKDMLQLHGEANNPLYIDNNDVRVPQWVYHQAALTKYLSSAKAARKIGQRMYAGPALPLPHFYFTAQLNNVSDYVHQSAALWARFESLLHDARDALGLGRAADAVMLSDDEDPDSFVAVADDPSVQRVAMPSRAEGRRVSATGEEIEETPREHVSRLEAMLRDERDAVENYMWRIDAVCQDVLITQCFLQAELHIAALFSQEWWVAEASVDPLLAHVRAFLKATLIGFNLNNNAIAVKRLFHKFLRNLSYVYVARLVAAATGDKRPEWAACMAAGKKPRDYSVLILSDKLQADFLKLRAFAKELARTVIVADAAEDARGEDEEERLHALKYARADFGEDFSLCAEVLLCLEKDNDQLLNKELPRLSARVSGIRYTYHEISAALRGCVVDTPSLLHAASLLRGVSALDTKAMLDAARGLLSSGVVARAPKTPLPGNRMRLHVWVECARELAAVNSNGIDSDPYVVVQLIEAQDGSRRGGRTIQKRRSRTVDATLAPDWWELLPAFSADAYARCDSVVVQVHDSNLFSYNVMIGAITLSRHTIEQRCLQRAAKEQGDKPALARRSSIVADVAQRRQAVLDTLPHLWGWYADKLVLEKDRGTLYLTFALTEE